MANILKNMACLMALCCPAVAQQGGGTQRVVSIPSMRAAAGQQSMPQRKSSYSFTLKETSWLDTGVTLAAGEQIKLSAKGSFQLADGRKADPAGVDRGWRDLLASFPANSAPVGALIGRISDMGASLPFLVGTDDTVTAPTTGRLYLGVNLPGSISATGSFTVKLEFPKQAAVAPRTAATPLPEVSTLVSPETFAGIPRRVGDQQGNEGDMVNFALVGTRGQVEQAFKAAGWVPVDQSVDAAIVHGILSTLSREAYLEMPMSTLYLFGRPQDMSYARGEAIRVVAVRHHLRVWNSGQTVNGVPLWVGSATHDNGFEKDQRNGQVTHHIDPEIDEERKFILDSFDAAGAFTSAAYVLPDDPFASGKTATGGEFHSDGRVLVMMLK
ncbi:LssY C-terminal domain-containing protein [Terriglobus tenax]|uniref:LssY C-terminal domain-containing protein n=1 Tax=Terriglobus tenax TaxID=1111115 RepID=UPI0021E0D188|nr:LssY C-terminal domain-containing protein [Terriglobus tenax]